MKKEEAIKAYRLAVDIEKLKKYRSILEDSDHKHKAHFELHQHFGEDSNKVVFENKYNSRFIPVVEQIIKELSDELAAM